MRKPRTAARRSNQRPRSGQSSVFDWKNHPVIIASGSAAASLLICIPVFTQLVLPTQVASLEIEILKITDAKSDIERQYSAALKDVKELGEVRSELSVEVEELRETVKGLEIQLVEARASNIFSPGSPYPVGLGLVRIGMNPSDIRRVYAEEEIEVSKDGRYVTVKLENSPFERETFYVADGPAGPVINHLSFDMNFLESRYSEDFVYKRLVEAFGAPQESDSGDFKWEVGEDYSLFAHRKDGYVVMRRGHQPIFWQQ